MSRVRRLVPNFSRGGLIGSTDGPESYVRELDTLPSRFCRAAGGTETVITQDGRFYRVHTYTDTDPTSLLLNFDGSNGSTTFTDESGWGHAVTASGNAQISTAQSKFGGASAAFDGSGDWLTTSTSSAFSFGTGALTVEAWIYITGGNSKLLVGVWQNGASDNLNIQRISSTGYLEAWDGTTRSSTTFVSLNAWHHVAWVRLSGGATTVYFNGTSAISWTSTQNYTGNTFVIGYTGNQTYPMLGYIDSLRITKGQALYTSAFTPSTTALTRVGSGSLAFTRGGAVEYLVVGAGGGGGGYYGGGGGAGGFRTGSVVAPPKTVNADVGGGGSMQSSGSASEFCGVISAGGGRGAIGGGAGGSAALAGGSGGGGGSASGLTAGAAGNTPSTSPSQGNSGGNSAGASGNFGSGGGGGASAAGGSGGSSGGSGGNGSASDISGSSVSYAGGGGGAVGGSGSAGTGGSGGGGNGAKYSGASVSVAGSSGSANTGGGGGGGDQAANAAGGSGIVIARYRITQAEYNAEAA